MHLVKSYAPSDARTPGQAGPVAVTLAEIDRVLDDARSGHRRALVIWGDMGSGKSWALDHADLSAPDMRTLRVTGVESEAGTPFGSLHSLVRPLLDHLDAIPDVQSTALCGVLGLADPSEVDRLVVGQAVVSLLAAAADERPVLCLVDDAHWLDDASTDVLLFAARRLESERVSMLFALRDGHRFPTAGLPELRLEPLDPKAARDLLESHASGLTPTARDRVIDQAGGTRSR